MRDIASGGDLNGNFECKCGVGNVGARGLGGERKVEDVDSGDEARVESWWEGLGFWESNRDKDVSSVEDTVFCDGESST
jgi:hypothetical protein